MKDRFTLCLWFDNQAETAAEFYTSLFKDSKIESIRGYGKEGFEIYGLKMKKFDIEKLKQA
jgi:predicted 3-demethylubiquinone-9 3-methyltransferase (glyoxalase superfamily)